MSGVVPALDDDPHRGKNVGLPTPASTVPDSGHFPSFMIRRRLYYLIKPYLPWRLRISVRRAFAGQTLRRNRATWPINPAASNPPPGWPGWPEGKRFAFVITHDVEAEAGIAKTRQLAELDRRLGFRSTFNFVPEGLYRVSADERAWLTTHGFEVGVHDFRHDGRLFDSRERFEEWAVHINRYLREWNATGFRAGFMLRDLAWHQNLDVKYDGSTFDTDPFELQSEGTDTIFPFWVPADRPPETYPDPSAGRRGGYLELPYTLPQDSTLFLLLQEKSPDIWKRKLDWIAAHGGMALINVHPDYIRFDGQPVSARTFPASHYIEFLEYVRDRYAGQYWQPVAGELAAFAHHLRPTRPPAGLRPAVSGNGTSSPQMPVTTPAASDQSHPPSAGTRGKIWIDLENTPHIPFFSPIIRELEKRDFRTVLTARDAYQTCEMATLYGFKFRRIGRHYGKRRLMKALGVIYRTAQLLPFALREKPILALNHGSRTQNLACNLLGIPAVGMMDYEHAAELPFLSPKWELVPEAIRTDSLHHVKSSHVRNYSGIKEDVYAPDLRPDPGILDQLQLRQARLVVTVRPPATEAHYHNPEAEKLLEHVMNRLRATPGVKAVMLPRSKNQESSLRANYPEWFDDSRLVVPSQVVDGLNLLWHSDLVVSGGGTMNREAAALGIPVYSIFRGTIGAVDRSLAAQRRLVLIETPADVETKIVLEPRVNKADSNLVPRQALLDIVSHIESIVAAQAGR